MKKRKKEEIDSKRQSSLNAKWWKQENKGILEMGKLNKKTLENHRRKGEKNLEKKLILKSSKYMKNNN